LSTMWLDEKIHDKETGFKIRERLKGRVDLQLGKKGITNSFLKEVKSRLEKQGVVKIRILKSFIKTSDMDRRSIARNIANSVDADLIDIRGYTFILVKKRDKIKRNSEK